MNNEEKILSAFNFMALMPENIYSQHLKTVGGISFTRREIDIIACLLSGRAAKTIASFLRISPKTVETHMRNIMLKIGGSSRESIIDFIEKAGKFPITRKHYQNLLIEAAFEKRLKEVASLIKAEKHDCILAYEQDDQLLFISSIEKSIKEAGIQTRISKVTAQGLNLQTANIIIYAASDALNKSFLDSFSSGLPSQVLFLFPTIEEAPLLGKERYIFPTEQENYYFLIFEILNKVLPEINFEKIFLEFKAEHKSMMQGSATDVSPLAVLEAGMISAKDKPRDLFKLKAWKRWALVGGLSSLSAIALGGFFKNPSQILLNKDSKEQELRSDLPLPAENIFLQRPALVQQIENSFKGAQGIQAVALVGIGGAGKTALARQYARAQPSGLVWEITAETKESLLYSFENLAYSLAKTEEEQRILRGIKDLRVANEREEKLMFFIKQKLKMQTSWLLIFDNIEAFTNIQKYFPYDSKAWGEGRVIVTTRDLNIKNNNYINHTIVVPELSVEEKLDLLIKIVGKDTSFSSAQKKQAESFLAHIPPFPLDVSIASYYLKAANISYEDYLNRLNKYDKQSLETQERFLEDASGYTKTRYSIIAASLQKLIDENKEFAELLLFISFLDAKDIPWKLLNTYKNDIIVDSFAYNLKKYSLIVNGNSNNLNSTSYFSLHKSTQEISRSYLSNTLNIQKNVKILESLADILGNYIAERIKQDDQPNIKNLENHCEAFLSHTSPWHNSIDITLLKGELGGIYLLLGNFKKAKYILEKTYSNIMLYKKCFKFPRVLVYLGGTYKLLGSFDEGKNFLKESLKIYKEFYVNENIEIAWVSAYLGDTYNQLGEYSKAIKLLEDSLSTYKKCNSKNLAAIAWVLGYMGTAYTKLGNYKKARNLITQSLSIYKKHYPDNNLRIAGSLRLLGYANMEEGNYLEARSLLVQSLKIYRDNYPEDHIRIAWILKLLADLYQRQGNFNKAKNLLERSLNIYIKHYGKEHVETARLLIILGKVYFQEEHLSISEDLFKRVTKIYNKSKHPEVYIPLESLGDLYLQRSTQALKEENNQQAQELKAQAIEYLNHSLKVLKANFPVNSPHVTRVHSKLDLATKN
ncbi:hypothetical protein IM40_08560 [Candidatus Paracaedimonas acanthamoebae]|nr:hypothetical protein IM40_08560 [Candidatus Paracaedimonas acanthamoebae]